MKTVGIVLLVLLVALGLGGGSLFLMYQSLHDTAIEWENEIEKKNQESEATLSNITLTIQDIAGVNGMYTDDLKEIVKGTFEGRYGEDGAKAAILMITEKNHDFDPSGYTKLRNVIEGGRKEFDISQKRKIEVCQEYKKTREYLVRGSLLRFAGFPKKNMDLLCVVVSDKSTRKAFDTGIQEPLIQRK